MRKTVAQLIEENTEQMRMLCAELRAARERSNARLDQLVVRTERKRAKVLSKVRSNVVPVSDIAAASANRALQKLGRR